MGIFDYNIEKDGNLFVITGQMSRITKLLYLTIKKSKVDKLLRYSSYFKYHIDAFFLVELSRMLQIYLDGIKVGAKGVVHTQYRRNAGSLLELLKRETYIGEFYKDITPLKRELYKHHLHNMTYIPKPHQYKFLDIYTNLKEKFGLRGALLDATMGSGKTYMALAMSEILKTDVIVILCPLGAALDPWVNSIEEELFKDKRKAYFINRDKEYKGERYIICHFDALQKLTVLLKHRRVKADMLIIDESQHIASIKTDRSIELAKLIKVIEPKEILPMSGTSIKDSIKEMIPLYRLLDPRFTDSVEERYKKLYRMAGGYLKSTAVFRYTAFNIKISNDEVELPELFEETIIVDIPDQQRFYVKTVRDDMRAYIKERNKELEENMDTYISNYETLRDKAYEIALYKRATTQAAFAEYKGNVKTIKELYKTNSLFACPDEIIAANLYERKVLLPCLTGMEKKIFKDSKSVYKYPSLKLLGEALGNVVYAAKLECSISIAEAYNFEEVLATTTRKMVVMTKYVDVCEYVQGKIGSTCVGIYGEHTKNVGPLMVDFKENKKKSVLVGTYSTISTAHRLTVANVEVLIDLPDRDYMLKQAIARIRRQGQPEKNCYVYKLKIDTEDIVNITDRSAKNLLLNKANVEYITGQDIGDMIDVEDEAEQKAPETKEEYTERVSGSIFHSFL